MYAITIKTSLFQLTPPRGGRRYIAGPGMEYGIFQLTPPRGGRHKKRAGFGQVYFISTHAPAWGATLPGVLHWS